MFTIGSCCHYLDCDHFDNDGSWLSPFLESRRFECPLFFVPSSPWSDFSSRLCPRLFGMFKQKRLTCKPNQKTENKICQCNSTQRQQLHASSIILDFPRLVLETTPTGISSFWDFVSSKTCGQIAKVHPGSLRLCRVLGGT